MPTQLSQDTSSKGLLGWFAGNHVAANLLMIFILVAGAMAMFTAQVEVFPEVSVDIVRITVPYLGASPSEVEEGVVIRVEEAIAGVDGIKRITSMAAEGSGTVVAEIEGYADIQEVRDDIQAEVDRIETFPEQIEEPVITAMDNRTQMIKLAVYGDASERTLKNLAANIRDDLTAMPELSAVEVEGTRDYEISIECSEETLRRHNLTFARLGRIITNSSLDLPGGSVKTLGGEILVRTKGEKYTGRDYADIVVLSEPDGTLIRLGDIAEIRDGFEDSDIAARYNGKRAAMLGIYRIGEQNTLKIVEVVKNYVDTIRPDLPAGIDIDVWSDYSRILEGRMNLLKKNGYIGICLVFFCLTLFLDLKLAFWTTLGIPISFAGAFLLMPMLDTSINMISLFAFIVCLGIVVDDAIVVGENIFDYRQKGMKPLQAAIVGAKEMAAPVTIAILTTIAAFTPLLILEGIMGKFIRVIPIVVICVLSFSLVEAFLILPAHLSGAKMRQKKGAIAIFQGWVRSGLHWFIYHPFGWIVDKAMAFRYATVASGIAVFVIIMGGFLGGHIKQVFFESMEADNMYATLTMPQGTTREHTEGIVKRIEQAALDVQDDILDEGLSDKPVYNNIATYIGSQPFSNRGGGPGGRGVAAAGGAHQAEINIELVSGEDRSVASRELARRWREAVGEITGAQSLTFTSQLFSAGDPINVELSHRNFDVLVDAAERLKEILADYAGVSEIADSFEPGKVELKLDMTDRGRTLGLTLDDLASQVRAGFYGQEVRRIQRGRDDIRVMLRYPESERNTIEDVRNMRVRLTDGTEIPFREVAHLEIGRGYAAINRADRRRIVGVTADVDETVANANEINQTLAATVMPKLQQAYPGLSWSFQGEQREQAETNASLARDLLIALLAIYGLLAVQFRSYIQPVIIMSAIPFGIIGAVIGHIIMGYNLSFLSFFGIVALTGVVVNDSLILIDLVNRRRKETNASLHDIVLEASQRRFRPILLTTLTTFLGLTPMLLETSLQARFLIPMAISLSFGVLFATVITLFLVPALYLILEDIKRLLAFTFGRADTILTPQAEEPSVPISTVFDGEVTRKDEEEKVTAVGR